MTDLKFDTLASNLSKEGDKLRAAFAEEYSTGKN
jgi:hypothetical protein